MAKAFKESTNKRANRHEEKVLFDDTFEDMIAISVKQAEKRSAPKRIINNKLWQTEN